MRYGRIFNITSRRSARNPLVAACHPLIHAYLVVTINCWYIYCLGLCRHRVMFIESHTYALLRWNLVLPVDVSKILARFMEQVVINQKIILRQEKSFMGRFYSWVNGLRLSKGCPINLRFGCHKHVLLGEWLAATIEQRGTFGCMSIGDMAAFPYFDDVAVDNILIRRQAAWSLTTWLRNMERRDFGWLQVQNLLKS